MAMILDPESIENISGSGRDTHCATTHWSSPAMADRLVGKLAEYCEVCALRFSQIWWFSKLLWEFKNAFSFYVSPDIAPGFELLWRPQKSSNNHFRILCLILTANMNKVHDMSFLHLLIINGISFVFQYWKKLGTIPVAGNIRDYSSRR